MVLVIKNLPANAGDVKNAGSVPRLGRSPGGGHGDLLQYSCLENPMDRRIRNMGRSTADLTQAFLSTSARGNCIVNEKAQHREHWKRSRERRV